MATGVLMRFALLLTLLFPLGQAVPPGAQTPDSTVRGTIQGIVRVQNSSNGIPDVHVTLTGRPQDSRTVSVELNTTTDSEGRFSFKDIAAAPYTIRAQKDGYFGVTTNGSVLPPFR